MSESNFQPADFFDAVHLQWTAVQRYSRHLAQLVLPEETGSLAGQLIVAPHELQP